MNFINLQASERGAFEDDRGIFAVLVDPMRIDGNVADVYGETEEEALKAARYMADAMQALAYLEYSLARVEDPAEGSIAWLIQEEWIDIVDAIEKQTEACPQCKSWVTWPTSQTERRCASCGAVFVPEAKGE